MKELPIKTNHHLYQDFQKFIKNYKTIVLAKYEQLTNKMMQRFEKMSAQAIAQYKTLSALVVAKYEKYVAEMKAKYGKDFDKMMVKVNEMIAKFNKMSAEMIAKYEKLSADMMVKYESLRGDLVKMFNEVEARVERVRLAFWQRVAVVEAALKSKLASMKKMTVQQTVDILIKVWLQLTLKPVCDVKLVLSGMGVRVTPFKGYYQSNHCTSSCSFPP